MKHIYAIVLCLVTTATSFGQGITLPKEVRAGQFPFVTITAQTEGKTVRWFFESKQLAFLPLQINDPKSCVIMLATGIPEGRYAVYAYTAISGEPTPVARTEIVVGDNPEPGPEPGPNPPTPGPQTPLEKNIYSAWKADGNHADKAALLAALYKEAATKTVPDASIKTVGDLFRVMKSASGKLISPTDLGSVRRTIADHLNSVLPTNPSVSLDAGIRTTAATAFNEIATALEKCK